MLAVTLFYLLFLVLLIILIFILLLYSGYHSRTLVPALLDNFYGLAGSNAGADITTASWSEIYLADGNQTIDSKNIGSINFGLSSSAPTYHRFSFRPMGDDRQRKLRGNVTLLVSKLPTVTEGLKFRLKDLGDGKTVGETSNYEIRTYTEGLTEIQIYFSTNTLSGTNYHHIVLEGQAVTNNISANNILVNSSYLYYY